MMIRLFAASASVGRYSKLSMTNKISSPVKLGSMTCGLSGMDILAPCVGHSGGGGGEGGGGAPQVVSQMGTVIFISCWRRELGRKWKSCRFLELSQQRLLVVRLLVGVRAAHHSIRKTL